MSYKKLLRNPSLDEVAMGLTMRQWWRRRWSRSWFGVVAAAAEEEEQVVVVVNITGADSHFLNC